VGFAEVGDEVVELGSLLTAGGELARFRSPTPVRLTERLGPATRPAG
jgi:hypothetical protein